MVHGKVFDSQRGVWIYDMDGIRIWLMDADLSDECTHLIYLLVFITWNDYHVAV